MKRKLNLSKSIAQKRFYLYNNVREKFKTEKQTLENL